MIFKVVSSSNCLGGFLIETFALVLASFDEVDTVWVEELEFLLAFEVGLT